MICIDTVGYHKIRTCRIAVQGDSVRLCTVVIHRAAISPCKHGTAGRHALDAGGDAGLLKGLDGDRHVTDVHTGCVGCNVSSGTKSQTCTLGHAGEGDGIFLPRYSLIKSNRSDVGGKIQRIRLCVVSQLVAGACRLDSHYSIHSSVRSVGAAIRAGGHFHFQSCQFAVGNIVQCRSHKVCDFAVADKFDVAGMDIEVRICTLGPVGKAAGGQSRALAGENLLTACSNSPE